MRPLVLFLALASSIVAAPLAAQEGHPLKGSWLGTWEGTTTHSPDIVVVLNWDGKAISGTINPGIDNIPIKNATLNPEGWIVHLEADAKDKSGRVITYVMDGKIENLHLPNRSVTGTWKSQAGKGVFKMTRQ